MAPLSIRLLGPPQVTLDGEPITGFESDKVRALLAYLATETGSPHRRERLAGLLWPERPESAARANLRVALSDLRQAIGDRHANPPFLSITRGMLQFNLESEAWIDVSAFATLLEPQPTARRTVQHLEKAVALYRGDFLEGFSLPDSAAFEEWALLTRERLARQAQGALRRLAQAHETRGAYERALRYARCQVEMDPWGEPGQRHVMRLLALTGQRNAALAQYAGLFQTLAQELGVEPEDETTALSQRIREGADLSLTPSGPPHNVPAPLTPFVGRKADLAAILQRLHDPACRLLTLVGPGGCGKTRLALEAARELTYWIPVQPFDRAFAHGIYFVSLAPLQAVDGFVPAVAEALGFAFHAGGDPRSQLLDHLRQKQMLLILDNFEHLLEGGVGWVVDVLATAPEVRVLVTSRTRLNLRSEHLLPVAGMAMPDEKALAAGDPVVLGQYDGIELFSIGAARTQPGFRLAAGNAVDVVRICRLVDGMPLGILLAAAWIDSMTPAQIASQIGRSLDFLEGDWLDLPARQRSLRALFDHSWTLLSEHERGVLQALSVFRGGFTFEAVQAVTGASLRELRRLVNQSLLHLTPSGRYELHELLRQYAAQKLEAAGRAGDAADAHSTYYAAALEQWGADLRGAGQQEALAEMEVEIENARAAWNWAARHGEVARLGRALDGLCHFYEWRVRYQEGEAACRLAAEELGTSASLESQRLLARLLVWQGTFTYLRGHIDLASPLLRRGLDLLEELEGKGHDTRSERAHALLHMAEATLDVDREATKGYCEGSLALYRAVGDRWGTAKVLALLGATRRRLDLYGTETGQLLKESLALRKSLGDRRGIARTLGLLGNLAAFQGQLEKSVRLYRESISLHRKIGDERSHRDLQGDLVFVLLALGEFEEARLHVEENLAICKNLGSKRELAYVLSVSSFAELHHGRYERARADAEEGIALAREVDFRWTLGSSLWYLGCAALASGATVEAEQWLRESTAVLRELRHQDGVAGIRATQAIAALRLEQRPLARECLRESVRNVVEVGGFYSPLPTLSALALYAADRGRVERALELYALASCSPLVANSRWYEDVAGRYLAALAAALPPDVAAAASERGRVQDLGTALAVQLAELERSASAY
jgi:predicted ATPase/DNA-binding SARP family transcriptional activator